MGSSSNERFYADLPSFSDFLTLNSAAHYFDLPDDWFVVITDVVGSTKAIEKGRYQEVNTIGAASISVLGKLWQNGEIPFVFGGDGASLLIPPSKLETVSSLLLQLRNFARKNFDLDLRVGVVPMKEIAAHGLAVSVGKFGYQTAKPIAFIRGGGLAWADAKIKAEPDIYCLKDDSIQTLEELKDLSCRWQPIQTKRGKVLSLLIRPTEDHPEIVGQILSSLTEILGGDFMRSSPVQLQNMKYKSYWQTIQTEFRYHSRHFHKSYFARLFWSAFSVWSIKNQRVKPFNAEKYTKQIPSHSDFRKDDDMLRLVIDCTPDQVDKIRKKVEALRLLGQIHYGIHESDSAIMTCLLGSANDGDHIHFIDGGDGGYAMAAKSLKQQISNTKSPEATALA
jgi:hypothetical protein